MAGDRLAIGDSGVTLDGVALPGLYQEFSIDRDIFMDSFQVMGVEGEIKNPIALGDAKVTLSLRLLPDDDETAQEKLARIDRLFSGKTGDGRPRVFRLYSPHAKARRLRDVLFTNLRSSDSSSEDSILANLDFEQHRPLSAQLARSIRVLDTRKAAFTQSLQFMAKHMTANGLPPDTGGVKANTPAVMDTQAPGAVPPLPGGDLPQ